MMKVIPFVREGLGNSSYLVQVGEKEAALINPDRSVDRYLKAAEERGWQIMSIFETHLHADFVSGAREVAHRTDAKLYAPAQAQLCFPHRTAPLWLTAPKACAPPPPYPFWSGQATGTC